MDNMPTTMMAPKRGPRPQVVHRIVRTLQSRLVTGAYPANSYLPSERQLAEDLRVGRQSVAAAIRTLSELGLVERHPGRGSYIRPPSGNPIALLHPVFPENDILWTQTIAILQGIRTQLGINSFKVNEINSVTESAEPPVISGDISGLVTLELQPNTLPTIRKLLADGLPCVVANLEQEYTDIPASFVDHHEMAMNATQLLIDMGHRRIGFIGNQTDQFFYAYSYNGFVQCHQNAGLSVDPDLVELRSGTMALVGYLGARRLLKNAKPPTAILVARDGYAEGVCTAAQEAGLVVGRDLSLIGFDNLTWPDSRDFLTTFIQPCAQLGEAAGAMLLEWILTGTRPANRKIEPKIAMRRSVGPAPV